LLQEAEEERNQADTKLREIIKNLGIEL
jgi:hypothetical protein